MDRTDRGWQRARWTSGDASSAADASTASSRQATCGIAQARVSSCLRALLIYEVRLAGVRRYRGPGGRRAGLCERSAVGRCGRGESVHLTRCRQTGSACLESSKMRGMQSRTLLSRGQKGDLNLSSSLSLSGVRFLASPQFLPAVGPIGHPPRPLSSESKTRAVSVLGLIPCLAYGTPPASAVRRPPLRHCARHARAVRVRFGVGPICQW